MAKIAKAVGVNARDIKLLLHKAHTRPEVSHEGAEIMHSFQVS